LIVKLFYINDNDFYRLIIIIYLYHLFLFIPKKPISGHIRTQILSECKDLKDVTDVMKTLEIAVGFLSTSGGDQEMSIGDYCRGVLLLNEGKSRLKNKKVSNRNKTETLMNPFVTSTALTLMCRYSYVFL